VERFDDSGLNDEFLNMPPKVQATKVNKWDCIKLKNFCVSKENEKSKLQNRKIFVNHVSANIQTTPSTKI
jgi:hypothetical protein